MQIELRFFASVREQLGTSQEQVVVPDAVRTVGDVRRWLAQRVRSGAKRWPKAVRCAWRWTTRSYRPIPPCTTAAKSPSSRP